MSTAADHSVKLRNWKADMDRATKSLSEIENRMSASRSEFETCENNKSLKISEAEQARVALESALQNRTDAAEALQDNTPIIFRRYSGLPKERGLKRRGPSYLVNLQY